MCPRPSNGDPSTSQSKGKASSVDDATLPWPEEPSRDVPLLRQIYNRWTFSYMNTILEKGSKQMLPNGAHLSRKDLFRIPPSMESEFLTDQFFSHYDHYKDSKHRILKALWKLARPTFVPAGFCQLVSSLCQVFLPLFVRQLLQELEQNPSEPLIEAGLPWAIVIFLTLILNAFTNHRHRHLATKAGLVMRTSLVSAIFQHTLKLTPRGKMGLTSGQVANLVAIDTQKLFEVAQEGHLIWSCPMSMVLVGILLLVIMGPSTLVGMIVLFLFVPIVKRIASKMQQIRQERVGITDKRVETVNAMLQGIRVTKLNNYETRYQERIEASRGRELQMLNRELFVWAITLVLTVSSPILASAATFATYVLVDESHILTPAKTFTVLLLFSSLRFPINYMGRLIGRAGQSLAAAKRIDDFLRLDTASLSSRIPAEDPTIGLPKDSLLEIESACFVVGSASTHQDADGDIPASKGGFRLSNITCSLKPGELLAVVGPVGAGKSTLVNGIIGEAQLFSGTCSVNAKSMTYASQIPFILNTTLRENVLFGLPFDQERYDRVIDACCLRPDIAQLGVAGDLTEIGERGITLSGGQKQRVSLARAAYASPDLVLCDDPLSALDAGTARKIFDQLFRSSDGPLSKAGILLVTHAAHFLNRADEIMLLVDGQMKFNGSWSDLAVFQPGDDVTFEAVESIRTSVQESNESEKKGANSSASSQAQDGEDKKEVQKEKGELMAVETREHGLSSLKTWLLWFHHAGGLSFLLIQILLMTIDRCFYVAAEYWLTLWTDGAFEPVDVFGTEFPAQTDGRSSQFSYLAVYAIILLISVSGTFARSEWAVSGGARCAKTVFLTMLRRVLGAPMSYFETTPMGRILNRFTFDMEVVDLTLTQSMSVMLIASSWFVAAVIIMMTIIPWMAFALVPVTSIYIYLLIHYRKSGADLQRIDAVSRSPVQASLSEGLDGAPTIKVFRMSNFFILKFYALADQNSSAILNFISAQRWLGIRIEMMGAVVVLVACLLVVCLNGVFQLESGLVALLIIWSSNFTVTLGFVVDAFGEAEAAITSIERVHSMAELEQEGSMETDPSMGLPPSWPENGELKFDNVHLRYREGLPLALSGLSFTVPPGKRCGVVGRTGAGKSTLTVGLFRLVEIESGSIFVDGIDLSALGLSDVRSRLSIIPQDPFLFAGTIRECLDPFGGSSDKDIMEALQIVRLSIATGSSKHVLEIPVEEGGANFSVGERQLLCLARALLAKPKVLVMDEATASVDSNTDLFIQEMLRTRFHNTTLLTVAHRLNTIMDYDLILVMDKGKAVEFGSPPDLLELNGHFTELVNSTGEESAASLREVARMRSRLT